MAGGSKRVIIVDTNIILRYLLYAYCKNEHYDVKTLDKKLEKLIKGN